MNSQTTNLREHHYEKKYSGVKKKTRNIDTTPFPSQHLKRLSTSENKKEKDSGKKKSYRNCVTEEKLAVAKVAHVAIKKDSKTQENTSGYLQGLRVFANPFLESYYPTLKLEHSGSISYDTSSSVYSAEFAQHFPKKKSFALSKKKSEDQRGDFEKNDNTEKTDEEYRLIPKLCANLNEKNLRGHIITKVDKNRFRKELFLKDEIDQLHLHHHEHHHHYYFDRKKSSFGSTSPGQRYSNLNHQDLCICLERKREKKSHRERSAIQNSPGISKPTYFNECSNVIAPNVIASGTTFSNVSATKFENVDKKSKCDHEFLPFIKQPSSIDCIPKSKSTLTNSHAYSDTEISVHGSRNAPSKNESSVQCNFSIASEDLKSSLKDLVSKDNAFPDSSVATKSKDLKNSFNKNLNEEGEDVFLNLTKMENFSCASQPQIKKENENSLIKQKSWTINDPTCEEKINISPNTSKDLIAPPDKDQTCTKGTSKEKTKVYDLVILPTSKKHSGTLSYIGTEKEIEPQQNNVEHHVLKKSIKEELEEIKRELREVEDRVQKRSMLAQNFLKSQDKTGSSDLVKGPKISVYSSRTYIVGTDSMYFSSESEATPMIDVNPENLNEQEDIIDKDVLYLFKSEKCNEWKRLKHQKERDNMSKKSQVFADDHCTKKDCEVLVKSVHSLSTKHLAKSCNFRATCSRGLGGSEKEDGSKLANTPAHFSSILS